MSLKNLALYHHWVGKKSREKLQLLTEEEFTRDCGEILGSIRQKVEHMTFAILVCFFHLNEKIPLMEDSVEKTFQKIAKFSKDELLTCWADLDNRLKEGLLNKSNGTVELKRQDGESFCLKKDDLYLQYITHTIYHRGQLNYCLKFLDKPRIDGDYLFYFDELDASLEENQKICD